ncbi:MAG: SufS family cysteine desulfurase [Bacilli bacterium]|jgi:cysteine desulfurase/selenocysteine lyase|nr:SufS family cysteine desulfurase [Bacilli bacterium]NLN80437.1 SufS family cysteine desulfurase [Erysipelotrichia bacterium]
MKKINPHFVRKDFPMFKNEVKMQNRPLVFLDNAATTFKPFQVIEAISNYYLYETANSHRGDYDLCYNIDLKIDEARLSVANFINAQKNEIVFTSGTSMSINLIAYGYGVKYLTKDDEILITQAEHASNVLPWFKVSELTGCKVNYIPLDKNGKLEPESLKKVISKKTKIVAVAHVSNVLGYVLDLKELAKITHSVGALLVCDGAQSVPHVHTDVKDLDVDFLSFSGHKMCGPTGVGVLYAKYHLLEKMSPFMMGGGMNAKFDMCGDITYLLPPVKFEAGTQNISGILGLKAAIDYLKMIGMENIHQHEQELRKYAIKKLKENPNIIIYNEFADSGIITFNYKGIFAQDLATYLNSQGIAVRSGQHCAKVLLDYLGEFATVRVSFYLYNTFEDIDVLVNTLLKGGDFLDAYFT